MPYFRQMGFVLGLLATTTLGTAEGHRPAGYTVMVGFGLDADGQVIKPKVVTSDEKFLNPYAITMVRRATWESQDLPMRGGPVKHIEAPFFFPVEDYEGNAPLPFGVSKPEPLKRKPPFYPYECRVNGISGGVLLSLSISADGMVKDCRVVATAHDGFAREAIKAFMQWKFKPAMLDGKPIECSINIAVPFQLEGALTSWHWVVAPEPRLSTFMVESQR